MFLEPRIESLFERPLSLLNFGSIVPVLYCLCVELDEDALAFVLNRRHPGNLRRQRRSLNVHVKLAGYVRRSCLKSCEASKSDDFPETVDEDDPRDILHPRTRACISPNFFRKCAGEKLAAGFVLTDLIFRDCQCF